MMEVKIISPDWNDMPLPVETPYRFNSECEAAAEYVKANHSRGMKKYVYIRFHQDYDGEILQTVYAVKYVKPSKTSGEYALCQLVFAGTPTRRWVSGNLLLGRLSGWFVLWDKSETKTGMLRNYGYDPAMYEAYKNTFIPGLNVIAPLDPCECEAEIYALRNFPKYMDVTDMLNECTSGSILDFINEFNASPMLERLQKAGISYLWTEKRLMHAKPKYRKRLLTYIKSNIAEIRDRRPSLTFIIGAMKNNMTIGHYEWYQYVVEVDRLLCGGNGFFMHEQASEVAKYLVKQHGDAIHYRDYLELSRTMGRDLDDRGVLFPRDFDRQFSEMKVAYEAQKNAIMETNIRHQLELLNLPRRYDHKGFSIRVLDTQASMTEIGNTLHNCVGTCGYGMRMANGEVVILAIYHNGEPVNCVELSTPKDRAMYRVLQNRGDHNQDSSVQGGAEEFLASYIIEANKAWRQSHVRA